MALSRSRRWVLLVTVSLGLVLITLDNTILYTALPTLVEELDASAAQGLWIINAYPVVIAGLLLGSGTLGDRVGHTRMFRIGLVVFGLASLAAAFSPTAGALIAARALLAVGAAAMMPATLSLIRLAFDEERERNVAIAVWGLVSVVAAALGPIIGGALLAQFWWGSVFLLNVPVVLVALVATRFVAPPNAPDPTKHWDAISSAQVMVGLVGAVFLVKELATLPPNGTVVALSTVAAVVGLGLFVRRQRRLAEPLLDFAIFRNPAFSAGVLGASAAMFVVGGVQLVTTQRFQLVAGFSPLESGLLVSAVAAGSLLTAVVGGALLHRTGLLLPVTGGFAIATVGLVGAVLAFRAGSLTGLAVWFVVTGAGLGLVMAVASTAIMGNAPARRAGMAAGVEEVSYEFGNLLAVALLGSLLTLVYTATASFPAGTPEVASDSVAAALETAAGDPAVVAAASAAYDTAYLVTMAVLVGVLAATTLATGYLLRRHGPGSVSQTFATNH